MLPAFVFKWFRFREYAFNQNAYSSANLYRSILYFMVSLSIALAGF